MSTILGILDVENLHLVLIKLKHCTESAFIALCQLRPLPYQQLITATLDGNKSQNVSKCCSLDLT